jgi:hypothetical protein
VRNSDPKGKRFKNSVTVQRISPNYISGMKPNLLLALLLFTWTCAHAQNDIKRGTTNIALIKNPYGQIIDSISIKSSLDETPAGFPFPDDTLYLDLDIFQPIDELTIETFAGGHAFGSQNCWVDPPYADIHLSISAGRNKIDSVSQSPVNRYFRSLLPALTQVQTPKAISAVARHLIYEVSGSLMAYPFIDLLLEQPNFDRKDAEFLQEVSAFNVARLQGHPYMIRQFDQVKLMLEVVPKRLSKEVYVRPDGSSELFVLPRNGFSLLNFYSSDDPSSAQDHQTLQMPAVRDSILRDIPVISISNDASKTRWSRYTKGQSFDWTHYWRPPGDNPLADHYDFFPGSTYVLLHRGKIVEGIYPSLTLALEAIQYQQKD